jgi:hypothetical protein
MSHIDTVISHIDTVISHIVTVILHIDTVISRSSSKREQVKCPYRVACKASTLIAGNKLAKSACWIHFIEFTNDGPFPRPAADNLVFLTTHDKKDPVACKKKVQKAGGYAAHPHAL